MSNPALAAALGLMLVLGAALLASMAAERRRRGLQARLADIASIGRRSNGTGGLALRRSTMEDVQERFWLLPANIRLWLDAAIAATGDTLATSRLIIVAIVAAAATAAFTIGFFGLGAHFVALLALGAAAGAPVLAIRRAQHAFERKFLDLFPDALDLMVRAVKAGLPVLDAMVSVGNEIRDPVGVVFRDAIDEMRIGADIETVLQRTADRIRVPDFRFFVVALALQRRTGGSLADTLANLAYVIRRRKELRLKARALSAESKAAATVLSSLPVITIGALMLFNPKAVQTLFIDRRGNIFLGLGILSLGTGIMVMRTIIKRSLR